MKLVKFYRNINQLEPVLVNTAYIAYIELMDDERSIIHMADGEQITVYGVDGDKLQDEE